MPEPSQLNENSVYHVDAQDHNNSHTPGRMRQELIILPRIAYN